MPATPRNLAQEIGKRDPFDLPEEEAFLNLWRTSAMLDGALNRLLRPRKLTKCSYNIVRILKAAGDTGRTGIEIAAMLVADVPDMARLIDRLERVGYLRRSRTDTDRRRVRNFLTDRGRAVVDELAAPIRELHRRQFAALSEGELKSLSAMLVRIRAGREA